MKQKITAPANRAVKVVVFEPRQTPEQDEVILEEFELKAGEEREIEIRSATAGYRTETLRSEGTAKSTVYGRDADEDLNDKFGNIPDAQERDLSATAEKEIEAGKSRQSELEKAEKSKRKPTGKRTTGKSDQKDEKRANQTVDDDEKTDK